MQKKTIKKQICIGILAHVDAGKTTLSEALLYESGAIRKLGRVDHQNAFLDTDAQERARGITIFSKQARLQHGETSFILLDTPGHVDFSAEMERTLQALDYAVLVISGKDGVQAHTATLWKLLSKYQVPVFLFINKMDLEGADGGALMAELQNMLDERCLDFSMPREDSWMEQAAMCDETLLEEFLETAALSDESLQSSITARKVFPCFFGSALKLEGIEAFLDGLAAFTKMPVYPQEFGARVYKITRDLKGNRLTHMKITGGVLHTKDTVAAGAAKPDIAADAVPDIAGGIALDAVQDVKKAAKGQKIEQIRIYSGEKFNVVDSVHAGEVCAATGLADTYAGQGLGYEKEADAPMLESVLLYQVILPPGQDAHDALAKLRQLAEEDPQLHVVWNAQLQEIQMQLAGEVQVTVLKELILERFGLPVEFGEGSISYKETIKAPVCGAGHFEPLRHYAEVHILLEPGKPGSGLVFDTVCSEDVLDKNWQRLILTHLAEREHIGVLTGSPVTDMKLTLLAGKAHLKHTEGGDFRQAVYRAVRQGLRKAESALLEPWYAFRLKVPAEMAGRAMSDVQRMGGQAGEPELAGGFMVLAGKAPVSEMKDYSLAVTSYTKGRGTLLCTLCGYEPCHNQEEVVAQIGYDAGRDAENTADSVFCRHGAGVTVKWDEADEWMHLDSGWPFEKAAGAVLAADENPFSDGNTAGRVPAGGKTAGGKAAGGQASVYRGTKEEDEELARIFERTYGKPKQRTVIPKREILSSPEKVVIKPAKVLEEYLLVDGYNIIFAWKRLKELAEANMDSARQALIEILSNYQGYKKCHVIAVFDAYRVKGGERRHEKHGNVDVIYTAEAETADMYIERTASEKSKDYLVRVATSDRLEQMIIVGSGAFKISADAFALEIEKANLEITGLIEAMNQKNKLANRRGIEIPKR